jgi:hypothetical protein
MNRRRTAYSSPTRSIHHGPVSTALAGSFQLKDSTLKTGKDIVDLAKEIQRQRDEKEDYIVDTRQIGIGHEEGSRPKFILPDGLGEFTVTPHTHGQVAAHTGIPKKYYDRMVTDAPDLWQQNVSHWFENKPSRHMVRTLDTDARAFLSDKYRPLDNDELFQAALPVLQERGVEIVSSEITDTRLYVKFLDPSLKGFIKRDGSHDFAGSRWDGGFSWGGVISNSEVGNGSLSVRTFSVVHICSNGMIHEQAMRQVHVGGRAENDGAFYKDDTRKAADKALFLKLRDTVDNMLSQEKVDEQAAKFSATTERKVNNPIKAVEVVAKNNGFSEDEQNDVLKSLIETGDLTQWGLANAVTRAAEDRPDYDRATEFEAIGNTIIDLTPNQWREVAHA